MQRIIRNKLVHRNSKARGAVERQDRVTRLAWTKHWAQTATQNRHERQIVKEERSVRRQDWLLGPLAPARDVGESKGQYGAIDHFDLYPLVPRRAGVNFKSTAEEYREWRARLNKSEQAGKAKRFEGVSEEERSRELVRNVVEGDRVVVVRGREGVRGKIGKVIAKDVRKETVTIAGVNVVDRSVPDSVAQIGEDKIYTQAANAPVPIADVRLVVQIESDDGYNGDAIVRHVHGGAPFLQRKIGSRLPSHTRYISGTAKDGGQDQVLPWPEDRVYDDFVIHDDDTLRQDVEEQNWTPTLATSPLGPNIDVDVLTGQGATKYGARPADADGNPYQTANSRSYAPGELAKDLVFSSQVEANKRRAKISEGIMHELSSKFKDEVGRDQAWVVRKTLEDARSVWYNKRGQAMAAHVPRAIQRRMEAQNRQRAREETLARFDMSSLQQDVSKLYAAAS